MTAVSPSPTPLVPGPLRRSVALLVTLSALLFTVLATRYAGMSTAGGFDRQVDAVVDPLGSPHQWFIEHAVQFGSPPTVVAMACLLAAICLLLGKLRLAAMALLGPGLTGVCTTLLKLAVGRTIDGELAFPSGHTGGATSVALVAALLVISLLKPGRAGALMILAGGGLVVGGGVAAAMIASNSHYPTDTIGGFCTAVVVVCGGALAIDRMVTRPAREPG